MEIETLSAENYFVMAFGLFFFVYGAAITIRRNVTSDPTDKHEGKIFYGFRARLMGFIVMILGISVVGFGLVAI